MSMCLQGMVDELIMKKEGRRFKRVHAYMYICIVVAVLYLIELI